MLVYINQMDNRCKYLAKLMTRDGYVKEWNINKEHVTLGVTKL